MGLAPKIVKEKKFRLKTCTSCGQSYGPEAFAPTRSFLYLDGAIPLCNSCVETLLTDNDFNWKIVNKLCQMVDVPFVPSEWERLRAMNGTNVFPKYAAIFLDAEYDDLGWGDYYDEYKALKAAQLLEDQLPGIGEERRRKQREKWGSNYDGEALDYLDGLYNGLMATQNVNGKLQVDQALKICKVSYTIDKKIEEGVDFDKLLGSYDKLVKIGEFTPKNVKNINDFDTTGELLKWMEKKGWRNRFYDNVTRDIVDETIKNFQNFNQRLYTNETSIGDEITRRIEALKSSKDLENYYGTDETHDLDTFDDEGYSELFKEEDDFAVDLEGGDDYV